LPLRSIPWGAVFCNFEHHVSDHGVAAQVSGDYAMVIRLSATTLNPNSEPTRIKLASGS